MPLEEIKRNLFTKLEKEYNIGEDLVRIIDEVITDENQSELTSISLIQQEILKKMFQPNPKLIPPQSFFRMNPNECSSKSIEKVKEELLDILLPIYDGLLPMDELVSQICSVMDKYPNLTTDKYFSLIKTNIFNETRDYCMKTSPVGNSSIKLLLKSKTFYFEHETSEE